MNILYLIPARGGSKGIPHKNIKPLAGKPLIHYSIDVARELTTDDNICVSTDDDEIIKVVEDYGLKVPFKRPSELATDTASTNDVILHAINYYKSIGKSYDVIVLLQPTSPLRKSQHIKEALSLYKSDVDMVISVKKSHTATVLCKENNDGFIELILNKRAKRRQDIDHYYEYNGAIYVFNTKSILNGGFSNLKNKTKYLMDSDVSIDIDSLLDWSIAELLIKNNII